MLCFVQRMQQRRKQNRSYGANRTADNFGRHNSRNYNSANHKYNNRTSNTSTGSNSFNEPETQVQSVEQTEQAVQASALQMTIGDTPVSVDWEDNESVEALKDLCSNQPLTIQMSMYGGFEQVGSIGADLPQNDVQTTTSSGDIVLYSGDQIVVFYGSNTWAYTRLGHIADKTQAELNELLSNGNITVTLIY